MFAFTLRESLGIVKKVLCKKTSAFCPVFFSGFSPLDPLDAEECPALILFSLFFLSLSLSLPSFLIPPPLFSLTGPINPCELFLAVNMALLMMLVHGWGTAARGAGLSPLPLQFAKKKRRRKEGEESFWPKARRRTKRRRRRKYLIVIDTHTHTRFNYDNVITLYVRTN